MRLSQSNGRAHRAHGKDRTRRTAAQRAAEDVVMPCTCSTKELSHKKRCLCGKFINSDGCGRCLHYVCARCKKVADHTNGTDDHPELCDACWSAEFANTTEVMAS